MEKKIVRQKVSSGKVKNEGPMLTSSQVYGTFNVMLALS